MTKKTILCLGVVTLCVLQAIAQFNFSAQIRPRAEYRDGYSTLPAATSKPAGFVSQRTRLNLSYAQPKLKLKISFQDVRTWGDETHLLDMPSSAMHEGWGEIELSERFQLRMGRQELVYNDHRLLGNVDWAQQARSHDAAVLKYSHKGWKADLGGAFNQEKEQITGTGYTFSNYKTLGYLWVNKTAKKNLDLSLLGISDGFKAADTTDNILYRFTYGLNAEYKLKGFAARTTVFGQGGQDTKYYNIAAWLGVLAVSYTSGKLKTTLGAEYLSGDDGSDSVSNTFNTLYATNHQYYGFMDYFINIPKDTRNGGLRDLYLKWEYAPSDKWVLGLDYHHFSLAAGIQDPESPALVLDSYLGSEADFSFTRKVSEEVSIKGGYSMMFATESMEAVKGGDKDTGPAWGWMMVNINPVLLAK